MFRREHAYRLLRDGYPDKWVVCLTERPKRLIVFVHGFWGGPTSTWQRFPDGQNRNEWWARSDMLFVGYKTGEGITAVANRLEEHLPRFYPKRPGDLLEAAEAGLTGEAEYEELVLVAHSLGGVIVRLLLKNLADRWADRCEDDPSAPRPRLLDAKLRLFSPASAGFRPAGRYGWAHASRLGRLANPLLRRYSEYSDLEAGSPAISALCAQTEARVNGDRRRYRALRAQILWASPENLVLPRRYDTDFVEASEDGRDHSSVCKPTEKAKERYVAPWHFVEEGSVPTEAKFSYRAPP